MCVCFTDGCTTEHHQHFTRVSVQEVNTTRPADDARVVVMATGIQLLQRVAHLLQEEKISPSNSVILPKTENIVRNCFGGHPVGNFIFGCSFCSRLMNCWNFCRVWASRFHLQQPACSQCTAKTVTLCQGFDPDMLTNQSTTTFFVIGSSN